MRQVARRHSPSVRTPLALCACAWRPQKAAADIAATTFPLKTGSLVVYSLGRIRYGPHDTSYCSENYLYPVGFKASREYTSYRNPRTRTVYTSTIVDGGAYGRGGICGGAS